MMHPSVVSREKTGLLVVDLQEKFRPAIAGFDHVAHNAIKLILGFQMHEMPVLVTEQYPRGLGPTVGPVRRQFRKWEPVEKTEFGCTENESFRQRLGELGLEAVVVCGIETHVCINQTALGLVQMGLRVHVVIDAVASRTTADHDIALRKMEQAGVIPSSTEIVLFEVCGKAGTLEFKNIQRMVKAKFTGWKSPAVAAPPPSPVSVEAKATPSATTVDAAEETQPAATPARSLPDTKVFRIITDGRGDED